MAGVTKYLARELYFPSGDVLQKHIVTVMDGRVLEWRPFDAEAQSMLLVEEMTLCSAADGMLLVENVVF